MDQLIRSYFSQKTVPLLLATAARSKVVLMGRPASLLLDIAISRVCRALSPAGWFESELSESYAPRANLMLVNVNFSTRGNCKAIKFGGYRCEAAILSLFFRCSDGGHEDTQDN
jgi:hypothetical protein